MLRLVGYKSQKLLAYVLPLGLVFALFSSAIPAAAYVQLTDRSLTLADVRASATTEHTIKFSFPSVMRVGSLVIQYCTSPVQSVICEPPLTGSTIANAVLAAQSGETGFSIDSENVNTIILSRSPSNTGTQPNSYTLANVVNQASAGPFYVRVSGYSDINGNGDFEYFGAVVGDTTTAVFLTAEVPPILNFCTGLSIPTDCSSATGNFLDLGNFSPAQTTTANSEFMVGTNAAGGYGVRVSGPSLTSGNNIVAPASSPRPSAKGTSQFGINLRANAAPPIGADPNNGSGNPAAEYNIANQYTYNDGDIVAASTGPSENELYTASYIINISPAQPIGVYATTLTYICTANF